MNENTGKTVSTLAIAEKRPQRPGGCVGIFFQLFDWNRRLAKKKLFSKKLLPPVRAKRITKKFGSDEKLPGAKLLLIADENRGGFPNKKPESDSTGSQLAKPKSVMQSPGLVARLMGLDSMPVVHRDRAKDGLGSEICHDQDKKSRKHDDNHNRTSELSCHEQECRSEKGSVKVESRPQKLQKTGIFERKAVSRFGTEALQFKGALSRSKKQHHKLASPVKSPRILSGRNAARLMEAATKILEPGLHASNRAKCALTYSPSPRLPPREEGMIEGVAMLSPNQSRESTYLFAGKSLKGQSSCSSCGNLLDVVDFRSNVEDQVPEVGFPACNNSNTFSEGLEKGKMKPPHAFHEQERDVDTERPGILKSQIGEAPLAVQAKGNVPSRSQNVTERKNLPRKDQDQCMTRRQSKTQLEAGSHVLKYNHQKQNQMLQVKDKMPPKPKLWTRQTRKDTSADSFSRTKDYISLNKNLNNQTKSRMYTKTRDHKIIRESTWDRKDESSSRMKTLARKRRPVATISQFENVGFADSSFARQRGVRNDVINGKGTGLNASSMNHSSIKTEVRKKGEGIAASSSKDAEIVSFMFNSPMSNSNGSVSSGKTPEKTRSQGKPMSGTTFQKKMIPGEENGELSYQRGTKPRVDALGALLEQKLRELTCAEGDALTEKCTASILQELISALTILNPTNQENGDSCAVGNNLKDSLCYSSPHHSQSNLMHSQMFNSGRKSQVDPKTGVFWRSQLTTDCDHPSPTSILDASFSNDSFCSESLDSSSGHKLNIQFTEQSHENTQPLYLDADLSDSATSRLAGILKGEMNSVPVDNISARHGISGAEVGSRGSKDEVISNAELFENINLCGADRMADSFVDPILLEKLEILADSLWRSPVCGLGFNEVKEGYQLRRFLFDCMIECLDSKYSRGCKSGFRSWSKLPLFFYREKLAREVCEEIRRCRNLAGKILDEIIERDMSHSLGKWTDFEIEAFETGVEIEGDILQILVDEMVVDFWQ